MKIPMPTHKYLQLLWIPVFMLSITAGPSEFGPSESSPSESSPHQQNPPNTDYKAITAGLDSLFSGWDSSETPGCAVGAAVDGRQLLTRAWGMADLEHMIPNTPATIFEAGSVSKQFVTASVILLAMEGKLSLEESIHEYVPEMPNYGHTITLRHLMNHTSGLRDWGSVAAISGWGRSVRTHHHDHVLDILSRQTRLNFPPGERYSYSNSGYNLLAIVVERVSGRPFAEFSDQRIFQPLGMTSTQWRDDYTRIVPGRSSAYSGSEGDEEFRINRPIEHVHGNGGLLTTVGDLLAWNHAVFSGYFGEEFTEELLHQGVLNSGRTIAYASGVRHDLDHGYPQITHTGATSGYRAYLSYYPEQKLSVALLCNVTGASPGPLGSSISELFLGVDAAEDQELAEAGEEEAQRADAVELSEEELASMAGIWKDPKNYRPLEIELKDRELRLSSGTVLTPVDENRLVVGSSETVLMFEAETSGGSSNNRPAIRYIREEFEEERLVPVALADEELDLLNYTGTFESRDAETTIVLKEKDEGLIAHRRPADTFELEPIYEGAFWAGGFGLIYFHSGGDGEVTGFSYSSGRVYDMRFDKVE